MLKTQTVFRPLLTLTVALAVTLFGINAPLGSTLRAVAVFVTICTFGAILLLNTSLDPRNRFGARSPLVMTLIFLVGATFTTLAWQLSLAISLSGFAGIATIAVGIFCYQMGSSGRRSRFQSTPTTTDEKTIYIRFVSTLSTLSLLLFVAAVPDLRSLLIPLSVLNCTLLYAPRARGLAQYLGLLVTVLIIRHSTSDSSVLVFTDDSIWAEGFSAIVQQTGFWSWVGVSDLYSPLHWLAYGVAGWFVKTTEKDFLYGVTVAFPAVMCVIGASFVSLLQIGKDSRSSFIVQVIAIIAGLQLIGSQSISADLGFLAVLTLTLVVRIKSSPRFVSHVLLVCISAAKVQFVPVAAIVVVVSMTNDCCWRDLGNTVKKAIPHLGTLVLSSLLVLDWIPLSRVFGWDTNSGWGASKIKFRGAHLMSLISLQDIVRSTFFIFVPAIVLLLVYLLSTPKKLISIILVPLSVTVLTFVVNVLFEIENREYFGWIAGAVCITYFYSALLGPQVIDVKKRLYSIVVASICALVLSGLETGRGLQRTQVVVTVLLLIAAVLSNISQIRNHKLWHVFQAPLMYLGITLLLLPSVISSADVFRESGLVIESKSGYSLSDLGYTSDLLQAGRWIRQFSDPSDVIGTNVLCEIGTACSLDGRPLVAAATHRRTFIEAERFAYGFSPIQSGGQFPSWILDRLTASMNCSSTGDQSACDALRSAGVDLLLVDTTRFSGSNGLPVCASFGSIQVVSIAIDKGENPIACPTHG